MSRPTDADLARMLRRGAEAVSWCHQEFCAPSVFACDCDKLEAEMRAAAQVLES